MSVETRGCNVLLCERIFSLHDVVLIACAHSKSEALILHLLKTWSPNCPPSYLAFSYELFFGS